MLKIAFHPCYAHPLPEGHRFPMIKYELIPEQMLYEGIIRTDNLFSPEPCDDDIVLLTHESEYVHKLKSLTLSASEQRRIGFPQSAALTEREWRITQGTIDCCHYALENGVAMNVAGGTHHAYANRGEGFCLLNDFAVAATYLLHKKMVRRILMVDLDVHQGNGTAHIFRHEPRVFTFSMHGRHNYPFHKEQSDLDVPLDDGIGDEEYLSRLGGHLDELLEKVKPDFVFYLSGVDVLASDRFGKMKLSLEGCRQRDDLVFSRLYGKKLPCVVAMGGGYSPDIRVIVDAHVNTFRMALANYRLA